MSGGIELLSMGNNFGDWLLEELNRRDWSLAELARRGKIDGGNLSRVVNKYRNPGPEMCRGLAKALGYSEEYVFRKAGLLSPETPVTKEEIEKLSLRELIKAFEGLTPDEREDVVDYAFWRWEQSKERKKRKKQRRANSATDPATGAA